MQHWIVRGLVHAFPLRSVFVILMFPHFWKCRPTFEMYTPFSFSKYVPGTETVFCMQLQDVCRIDVIKTGNSVTSYKKSCGEETTCGSFGGLNCTTEGNQDICHRCRDVADGCFCPGNLLYIFTYLSMLYDVDIEALACVLSSPYARYAMLYNKY